MHKSTTFGLFLIASLLVGTAANMQMFSNAVAQEYGQYDNSYQQPMYEMDPYEQSYSDSYDYEKEPTYDKKPSYDKYSSDSYGDKYSEHKTKVNKYVCQRGPFEGFFVSSVEWCEPKKFEDDKFDDKKIIKEGPSTKGDKGDKGDTRR